jgi:hypothetical protein
MSLEDVLKGKTVSLSGAKLQHDDPPTAQIEA